MSTTSSAAERAALETFLDYQRESLIGKLQGLTEAQARAASTVSSLSLLSWVKHSATWERRWFQVILAGRDFPNEWSPEDRGGEDPTFTLADEDTIESVLADYRVQIAGSKDVLGSLDLETPCAAPDQAHHDLRWVALHMIEETARHAGHADIIRETIDGARGR